MPIYEYKCTECQQHIDVEQSFTDDALTVLDGCEIDPTGRHQLKKVFSAVGISFKGDGFYRNDARAGASKSSSTSGDKAGESSSESTSNGSSSDSSSSESTSSTSTETKKADSSTTSNGSASKSKSTSKSPPSGSTD